MTGLVAIVTKNIFKPLKNFLMAWKHRAINVETWPVFE